MSNPYSAASASQGSKRRADGSAFVVLVLFAILVVVGGLVALKRIPYPGDRWAAAAPAAAVGPAGAAGTAGTAGTAGAAEAAKAPAAAATAPAAQQVKLVTTRECTRSILGGMNCTQVTTRVR